MRSPVPFAVILVLLLLSIAPCRLLAGVTERVSVSSSGAQGNASSSDLSISADGRYVAFDSSASNLVPGANVWGREVFLRDRTSGTTEWVSVWMEGTQYPVYSGGPYISADGRYVAFTSDGHNLVPGDTNGKVDVFVRDRIAGTTERVSVSTGGGQGNADSRGGRMSADGRYAAFWSYASNLVPGDTNGKVDVFVRDRIAGTTERVSVSSSGEQGNDYSYSPSISADGRYAAFWSYASNLVPGDTNGKVDVFVRDRLSGTTERVSVSTGGEQGNGDSLAPSLSADGRFVTFDSFASNLVPGDTNGTEDVFLRDRVSGTTERVSVSTGGTQGNWDSWDSSVSADGHYVAFDSFASNLVPGDTNGYTDVFVRDRWATGTPPEGVPGYEPPSTTVLRVRHPYADQVQQRAKGQLHAHYYNDAEYEWGTHYIGMAGIGSKFVGDLVNSYADKGYDFVCVTEHNHCSTAPSASQALYMQYCEEVTTGYGHVLAIGTNKQGTGRAEEWRYYPWDTYNSLADVVDANPASIADVVNVIHSADYGNGLAIVAHPASKLYPVSTDEIWKAKPNGVSVWTAASFTNSESIWDELLTAGMFIPTDSSGNMLLFGATEDDFTPPITPWAHGRTWVVAELDSPAVTQENIIRALKNGKYWSYRSQLPYTGNGPILHLTTDTNAEGKPVINVTSDTFLNDIAFVYRKKDVGIDVRHNWGLLNSAQFTCQGDEIFVRVEAYVGDIKVYSQPVAVVWEWTSGGAGGSGMAAATALATPSDLTLACALPEQLPDKSPPLGYIGRAYFASTTSGTYPPDATLTLSYEGLDVTPYGSSNLAIYRWDDTAGDWAKLTSTVDAGNALVTAPLTQAGLYTISAEIVGDSTPPTVTIHTPADNATLTGPDVVGLQVTDNVGVQRTSFYLGDQCIGVDSTSYDGFTCSFDFGMKSAGQYILKAIAEDVSGNTGEAQATVNISSSGVTPTVAITSPTNGATLSGTAAVMGTCSDDSLVTGVFVSADGIPVGEATLSLAQGGGQEWSYDLDTTKLADGPHNLVMDDSQNTSEQGIGVIIAGTVLGNVSAARMLADGEQARLSGRVVTFGDPGTDGAFYIEEQNRSSGVRVEGGRLPSEGDMVALSGLMTTRDGERSLVGADVNVLSFSNPLPPPLAIANILLGGGALGDYIPGITGGFGLNNIALLVRAWGKVTQIGGDYLYVNDGSNLKDGTMTGEVENVGVRVVCNPAGYSTGEYLAVTGISSCFKTPSGQTARRILTRRAGDVNRVSFP